MHRETQSFSVTVPAGESYHILWMPGYHCQASNDNGDFGNAFTFNGVTTDQVINTLAVPWGNYENVSTPQTVYKNIDDPCARFINNSGVRDARAVAACIDIEYTGRTDSESGQIGSFVAKLGDFWHRPPNLEMAQIPVYTYDDVLGLSKQPVRPSTGATVKWVPNFAGTPLEFFAVNRSPIYIGEAGVATTVMSENRQQEDDPSVIGVAVAGSADAQTYRITMTKIIEYREDGTIGKLVSTSGHAAPPSVTPLERAAKALSGTGAQADESWQTKALNGIRTVGAGLLQMAPDVISGYLTGVSPGYSGLGALPRAPRSRWLH